MYEIHSPAKAGFFIARMVRAMWVFFYLKLVSTGIKGTGNRQQATGAEGKSSYPYEVPICVPRST